MLDQAKLRNEIKMEEGSKKENGLHIMYFDSLGKPTIGYGTLIAAPGGIPESIADLLVDWKIKEVMDGMDSHMLWWRGESDMRKRALINICYQLGIGGVMDFKRMLYAMQHGDYKTAYKEALDSTWYKQTPKRAQRMADMILAGYE